MWVLKVRKKVLSSSKKMRERETFKKIVVIIT